MKRDHFYLAILFLVITHPLFSQSIYHKWTEQTYQDFSDNQVNSLSVLSDSGGIVRLQHPLVKTVNDYSDNSIFRHVTRDSAGNFVRIWVDNRNVYVRKYNADGIAVINSIQVNSTATAAHQCNAALLNDGTFLVVWTLGDSYIDIYGQVFNSNSEIQGDSFKINDRRTGTNAPPVAIANNKDHCFELFFTLRELYPEDKLYNQKRDVWGNIIGETERVNKENITTAEYSPRAVAGENSYWIAWLGDNNDTSSDFSEGLYLRHFAFDGTPLKNAELVLPRGDYYLPDLCLDKNHQLLLVWEDHRINELTNIFGQIFDSTGTLIGGKVRINDVFPDGYNQNPEVELVDNEFQISWLSWSDELDGYATYVCRAISEPKLSGEMVSTIFDGSPEGCLFNEISWDYNENPASNLSFQLRSANTLTELDNAIWYGPTSLSDFYSSSSGEAINSIHNGNRYIQYKAYFNSEYGNSPELKSISIEFIPNDLEAPQPPSNLTVTNDHVFVYLNWQPSPDNDVALNKIYRGSLSNNYEENWNITIPNNTVSCIDSSAEVGKMYYYTITAIDSSHNESGYSVEVPMMFSGINFYVSENGTSNGSGSINDPVKTIPQGMNLAAPGDTINVMPGTYSDTFSFKKRVALVGLDVDQCVLNCEITPLDGCLIKGFTIKKTIHCKQGAPLITENIIKSTGYAIYLSANGEDYFSSAIITKNFITGCTTGIYARNDVIKPVIKNNIITATNIGIGIGLVRDSVPEIINNTVIVTGNESISLYLGRQIKVENNICVSRLGINAGSELASMSHYNDFWGESPANFGIPETNISLAPLFINEDISDYNLMINSPCKDAGNPNPQYNDVDDTRNDIGAYGGPDPFNLNILTNLSRSVSVSSLSGYPNDTVSVFVSLNKTNELANAEFTIEYDNSLLSFQSAKLTEATSGFSLEQQILSTNEIKFSLSSSSCAAENLQKILQLDFIVGSSSKTGNASPLVIKNVELIDNTSKKIIVNSLTNGAFVVNNSTESDNFIYVDSNNSGDENGSRKYPFNTINEAISAAIIGDTIFVAGGDYYESFTMKEGVSLIGSGSSVTNIVGTGSAYTVLFNNISTGELSGFTFKSDANHLDNSAVIICNQSSPVIKKCRFETELFYNVAITCENNSNPMIEKNYLNKADIWIDNSSPIIRNNSIRGFLEGIRSRGNSNPEIINNSLSIERAISTISVFSPATIKNNIIHCELFGFGICIYQTENVNVFNNILKVSLMDCPAVRIQDSQNINIVNNTIVSKSIGIEDISSTTNILNNIITENDSIGVIFSDASTVDYNAFWNNSRDFSGIATGSHNLQADIQFADTSKENYRLLSTSPCIDAGNPDIMYNDTDGSRNDIGAYGGPYADSSWVVSDAGSLAINQVTETDTIHIIISGEKIRGIAGMNLIISYDPGILSLSNAMSSGLTKSFSVEQTNHNSGQLNLTLNSSKGIVDEQGELLEILFTTKSSDPTTTTLLHFIDATAWDETSCPINISELIDGELTIITNNEKTTNELPKTYYLSQNYPNPFNPTTIINYSIPHAEHVCLKIYDILGREVAVLVDREQVPGNYKVEFNGEKFASGVYLYNFRAVGHDGQVFEKSAKMMLIK